MAFAAAIGLAVASGCQGPPKLLTVRDVKVIGIADLTGRCPGNIKSGISARVRTMAVEAGLIGGAGQQPGKPILLRGQVVEFPTRGRLTVGSTWINSGPISIEWIVMQEDGTQLGTTTITTDPRDADDVPEDPFVYTQARAVVLWLLGK